jgi:hypothetical protein
LIKRSEVVADDGSYAFGLSIHILEEDTGASSTLGSGNLQINDRRVAAEVEAVTVDLQR